MCIGLTSNMEMSNYTVNCLKKKRKLDKKENAAVNILCNNHNSFRLQILVNICKDEYFKRISMITT